MNTAQNLCLQMLSSTRSRVSDLVSHHPSEAPGRPAQSLAGNVLTWTLLGKEGPREPLAGRPSDAQSHGTQGAWC